MPPIIQPEHIVLLENLILEKLECFYGLLNDNKSTMFPVWTCYINGKGEKISFDGWNGIFNLWAEKLRVNPFFSGCAIHDESWYRNDKTLVCYRDWWKGDYQIKLIFEQENNPAEIRGHFRQLFDFAIPEKILLIWTDFRPEWNNVSALQNCANEVLAEHRRPPFNKGNIHLIIGDWAKLARVEKEEDFSRELLFRNNDTHGFLNYYLVEDNSFDLKPIELS